MTEPDREAGPEESRFRADLGRAPFQSGQDRGYWRLRSLDWPHAVITVTARRRPRAPWKPAFRFQLDGYPRGKPAGQLWDLKHDRPLPQEKWPRGGRLSTAFNPGWKTDAIYIPLDRVASEGHPAWEQLGSGLQWDPEEGIVQYLRLLRELLTSEEYEGVGA